MGQQIASRFASSSCGVVIAAPVRTESDVLTIAPGAGNTKTTVYEAAVGDKLALGGQVYKSNECDRLKIEVTYADGGDCNVCTPDTITGVVRTYFAEANGGGYDLKNYGFVTKIEVTVVDAAGAPLASALGGDVWFESERAALCNEVYMS